MLSLNLGVSLKETIGMGWRQQLPENSQVVFSKSIAPCQIPAASAQGVSALAGQNPPATGFTSSECVGGRFPPINPGLKWEMADMGAFLNGGHFPPKIASFCLSLFYVK